MYNALQVKYWNLSIRFPSDFWSTREIKPDLAIMALFLAIIPFKWKYAAKDNSGLLISYILLLVTSYSYAFQASIPRFLATNPLFSINLALLMTAGENWRSG